MNHKTFATTVRSRGDRQVETIASTATLDREGDRILATAWQLDNYLKNPVVLWAHDYHQPPVAKCVSIRVVDGTLKTVDQFPPQGAYPFADTVHDLVREGVIAAKSVGFRPITSRPNDEGGRDYLTVELLEHSWVPVPANPQCLVTAKAKGLDRARLNRFFGTTEIDIESVPFIEPAGVTVTPADVRRALATPELRRWINDEARERMAVALRAASAPAADHVIVLDDEVEVGIDAAQFEAALRSALPAAARVRRGAVPPRGAEPVARPDRLKDTTQEERR